MNKNKVIGFGMTPAETQAFFKSLKKQVLTFFGYSVDYENEGAMLAIAKDMMSAYSPETALINIGAIYPLAKGMGFKTTGIVSSLAIEHWKYISNAIDHVCFVADQQWGGKLPDSNELSPTSQAMVSCSDVLIGIGGGEVTRDELIVGRERGKPIYFHPAEINHEYLRKRARKMNLPVPESFWGAAHDVFGNKN